MTGPEALVPLTEGELETVLQTAQDGNDLVMVDIVKQALAGDTFYRGLMLGYVRNVPLYHEAVEEMRGTCGKLVAFADGELTGADFTMFLEHFQMCDPCRKQLGGVMELRARIGALGKGRVP